MPPLAWDQSFNVGHQEIDCQHQELLALMNEMESLLLTAGSYNILERLNLLEKILAFSAKHFRLERAVIHDDGNADTAIYGHWRRHKIFDAKIYSFYRELLAKRLVLDSDILTIIKEEFHDHINKGSNLKSLRVRCLMPRPIFQISGPSAAIS